MIHFIKFIAFSLALSFNGTNSISPAPINENLDLAVNEIDTLIQPIHAIEDNDKGDNDKGDNDSDKGESRIPNQPTQHHNCGFDHAIDDMRKSDPHYDDKLEYYNNVVLPELQEKGKQQRLQRNSQLAEIISMPIVFHIIHKPGEAEGTGENLTDQTIIDQLETLNEDVSATNAGWANVPPRWAAIKGNPELKFCLAEFGPDGAATSGIVRHEYSSVPNRDFIRNTIKPQTGWPTQNYYNVWILPIPGTTAFGGVLGWAFFPFPGTPGSTVDGCVQDYRFTGKGGKTLSHEVGHSFGLPHVWGNSGGCANDDNVADTPGQETDTNSIQRMSCNGSAWPAGPTSCTEEHMYINYMDYSPDACALTFTIGQADVMRGVALGTHASWASRNQLVQNASVVAQSCQVGTPTGGGNPGGGGGGPPIVLQHDAGIQTIITPTNGEFCSSENITPIVLLTNDVGDTPLTSCVIRYKISGEPGSIAFNWSGNLAKGENEEVSLAPFVSPDYSFEFTSWTTNPNGEDDENGFNDERAISLSTPEVFDPNIFEDFEDETDLPTSTNIDIVNPGNNFRKWDISESSAYGIGEGSIFFRNFTDPTGEGALDIIEFPVVDFSEIENPRLAFDLAYYYNTNNTSVNDSLRIRVSPDCGDSFITVFYEGGQDLATASAQQDNEFFPEPNQWRNEVVDLEQFVGANRLIIEITNIGYSSNNVYLDNINLSDGCASSVQVESGDLLCADDCTGFVNLILNGFTVDPVITWSNNVNGQSGKSLEDLCPGTYSVTVLDTEFECEFIQEIEISSPDELELIVEGNDILVPGTDSGSAIAQGFGGTGFYDFIWDTVNQDTDPFLTGLLPGEYCVTITDQAGCSKMECVEIFGFDCVMEVTLEITQPACGSNGVATGTVTIVNAVGNPNVVWSQGGVGFPFAFGPVNNNLTAQGGSTVVITDVGLDGCEEFITFEIFPASLPVINPLVEQETGPGNNDGSIILNVDDTDSDYTFTWSTGNSITEELTDLGAGFYTVTISDNNNDCELIETFEILNLNCTLQVNTNIKEVSCFDGTDGELEVLVSGGTTPYVIMWPSGPNVIKQTNLTAGIYPITVVDNGGCRLIVDAIIGQPSSLSITLSATDESSPGAFDGTVTASVFGGTMEYNYAWSNSVTGTETISGLGGGIYLVTVTDANGCESVTGASVDGQVCPEIVLEVEQSNLPCFEQNIGEVAVVASGGTGTYTYLWTPGDFTTATVSNLSAGEYNVVVTDEEGCPANATVTLTQPDAFTLSLDGMNESSGGAMDGAVTSIVTGGVGTIIYSWSGPPSFTAGTPNISLLTPAEYCLVVTDESNCTATECIVIGAGVDPCLTSNIAFTSIIVSNESVLGAADGSINAGGVTGSNGQIISYTWTDQNDITYTGNPIENLAPGTYTLVAVDEFGCEGDGEAIVLPGADPCENFMINDVGLVNVLCRGEETGFVSLFLEGGAGPFTYTWSDGAEDSSINNSIAAGEISVTVTDDNGCTVDFMTIITEPELAVSLSASSINESSPNANNGSATATMTGGVGPYTYAWTASGGFTSNLQTIENLIPDTYCVTATDTNGCFLESCVTVTASGDPCEGVSLAVNIFVSNQLDCTLASTEVSFEADGGVPPYTVEWSTDETTSTIEVEQAGTIGITVFDANGCMITSSAEVTEADILSATIAITNPSSTTANDGSASVITNPIEGEFTYDWTTADQSQVATSVPILDQLSVGIYTVTVTDLLTGCDAVLEFVLTAEAVDCSTFEIAISGSDVSCNDFSDGLIELDISNGTGPFDYNWNPELENEPVQNGLEPGLYEVTVTDANGCSDMGSFEIGSPDALVLDFEVQAISSAGANDGALTAIITGGIAPYEYNWSTGVSGVDMLSDLEPGLYCVTVTDDNGCAIESCTTLEDMNVDCSEVDFELVLTSQVTCFGAANGSIQVNLTNAQEPITYEWSGGLAAIQQQTDLEPGVYTVIVIDGNGCSFEGEVEITQPGSELTIDLMSTNVSSIGGSDGTASVVAMGGDENADYTYFWSDADGQTTATATDLAAGEYCVTVGSGSCTEIACVDVFAANDPCVDFAVEHEVIDILCFGQCNGAVNLTVTGGEAPYTFSWSDGTTSEDLENACGGLGSVTITDVNNCTSIIEFVIGEPDEIELFISSTNATDATSNDGTVNAAAFGGTPPFVYNWDNGSTGSSLIDLTPGTYEVTVTDDNGCTAVNSIVVGAGEDACSTLQATLEIQNVSCFGESDALVTVNVEGGSGFYFYDWSNGNSLSATQGSVGAGDFTIVITDQNDCELSLQGTITQPDELLVNTLSTTNTSGENLSDGSVAIEIIGGVEPYQIDWDQDLGDGTVLADLPAGVYTVQVADANGCTTTQIVTILDGTTTMGNCDNLSATYIITPVSCFSEADGAIDVTPQGGTEPYTITSSATIFTGLPASVYTIMIVDAEGCSYEEFVTIPSPGVLNLIPQAFNGSCGTQGIAEVIVTGGAPPFDIQWSNGESGPFITGLEDGVYAVSVTDANNCTDSEEVMITNDFMVLEFEVETTNATCADKNNGLIQVKILSGEAESFLWNDGITTEDRFDIPGGEYTLEITDTIGCTYVLSRTILAPSPITAGFTVEEGATSTLFDVSVSASGGTAPYDYEWEDGSNTFINLGISIGTYSVTITDDNNCPFVIEVVVEGTTATSDNLDIISSFALSPNPTNGQFFLDVTLSQTTTVDLAVYNIVGQIVYESTYQGVDIKEQVDLSNQPAGTYFIRLFNESGQMTKKLIKVD